MRKKNMMIDKQFIKIVLFGMITTSVQGTTAGIFHDFTYLQGQTIQAQILKIDIDNRKILLERKDLATAWVSVDSLSSQDRNFITDWHASSALLAPENLKISVNQQQRTPRATREGDIWQRKTPYRSAITFENESGETIEGLRIEYCYYIIQSTPVESGRKPRIEVGTFTAGSLTNGETRVVNTDNVTLSSEYTVNNSSGVFGSGFTENTKRSEEILGLWIRVFGMGESGIPAVREVCLPENLHDWVSWQEPKLLEMPDDTKNP